MSSRRRLLQPMIILDLLVLVTCVAAACSAWHELFVEVPGVHIARFTGPWSTPKTAALAVLLSAALSIIAALLLLVAVRSRRLCAIIRSVELGAAAAMICAYLVWVADFFTHAGRLG